MKYTIIIILLLISGLVYSGHKYKILNTKYKSSIENIKAYESQYSTMELSNRMFKLTIEQLNYSNDSIVRKMKKVQRELDIKDSKLQQLQYEVSTIRKRDTIIIKDTLFRDPQLKLDTIVGDKWFKTTVHLQFPGTIVLSPEVELERYVFINGKRETINPPKKFFLFRLFQKKHTTVEVNVREMNPYVKDKTQRFIQIIK